jgi:hypothetical protein
MKKGIFVSFVLSTIISSFSIVSANSLSYPNKEYQYDVQARYIGENNIDKIGIKIENDILKVSIYGQFAKGSHIDFFINSDGNENSGYKNNGVNGADYLIEDGRLYRDNIQNKGWKWDFIKNGYNFNVSSQVATLDIPLKDLKVLDLIYFSVIANSHNWQSPTFLGKSLPLKLKDQTKEMVTVKFKEDSSALKNPLKGFISSYSYDPQEFVSLSKDYVHWNDIESSENDSAQKVIDYTKKNLDKQNVKSMPRVILEEENGGRTFFPSDLRKSDHDSENDYYIQRVSKLIPKLAKAWDNDPHIGFVQMGIHGTWGEQFSPLMSDKLAKSLGDLFKKYFKNKKVMVRVPNYFNKWYLQRHNNRFGDGNVEYSYKNYYDFGIYWDAFAWSHEEREDTFDMSKIIKNSRVWVNNPIVGEVAFNVDYKNINDFHDYPTLNWTNDKYAKKRTRNSIHDTLSDPKKVDYLLDYIYSTHTTALSWITQYDPNDPVEESAAKKLQKAMGYRYIVSSAKYSKRVMPNQDLSIKLDIVNKGSAPFYYKWPLKITLLDKSSKKVVYQKEFDGVDIRKWLPGDDWDADKNYYKTPASTYHIEGNFKMPLDIKMGRYTIAIEIDDPATNKPSVKFATQSRDSEGRLIIGDIDVGAKGVVMDSLGY